jgi:carbon monoxide dehydrogenase subunit G
MATAAIRDELTAPIEQVWACFADFGDLSAWAPGMSRVTVDGSGVGAVRTVGGGDTPPIRERLVTYDPAGHTFSYAMLDSPFPFTDYLATVRLGDLGGGRTSIEWSSTFEPRGVSAEEAGQTIEGLYRVFVARLKQTLASS